MRGARPSVLVVDGPSLGALGRRDPALYGTATYRELTASVKAWADDLGMDVESIQSDSEGGMGYMIQQAMKNLLPRRQVGTILTQVLVGADDPAARLRLTAAAISVARQC